MKKFSKFLATFFFVVVSFLWLYLFLVITILVIPDQLWEKALSFSELLLCLAIAVPVAFIWLFISAYTWVAIFSTFFEKDIFVEQINKLGGPKFIREYLIKKIS